MKYYGKLGFSSTEEVSPGKWKPSMRWGFYYGDILSNSRYLNSQEDSTNDDFNISNQISVLSDDYIQENLGHLKCAEYMGTLWNVKSARVVSPRVIMTLGGVYNGEQA